MIMQYAGHHNQGYTVLIFFFYVILEKSYLSFSFLISDVIFVLFFLYLFERILTIKSN